MASKRLLTLDVEVLEASGASKGDQESPKRRPRRLGSLEVLWALLEVHTAPQATILDTFIVFRASKKAPRGPQVTIYRFCRRFRGSRRGTTELDLRLSRARSDPQTRSRTLLQIFIGRRHALNADAPSSPEGRRISLSISMSMSMSISISFSMSISMSISFSFILLNSSRSGSHCRVQT